MTLRLNNIYLAQSRWPSKDSKSKLCIRGERESGWRKGKGDGSEAGVSLGCLWNLKEAMVAGAELARGREAVGETMGLEGKIAFYFTCL